MNDIGAQMLMVEQSYQPGPSRDRALRDVLGCFTTGIAVVTAHSETGPQGVTVNSFASVSLDPPIVLWSPAKSMGRYELFTTASHYTVHILADDQIDLSKRFVRGGAGFDGLETKETAEGVPYFDNALARFDCQLMQLVDGGDHTIVLGRVIRAAQRDGAPLCFAKGKYGGFVPHD